MKEATLHCYSDASDEGYGQASYLRTVYGDGAIDVVLVMGKTRVAPSKAITIPRLELTAATTSAKFAALVEELQRDIPTQFLTDSRIVLGYIANESKRFRIFVANRINLIHSYSSPDQWDFVPTEENPVDLASRGMHANETEKMERWLYGPASLRKLEPPSSDKQFSISDEDTELRKACNVLTVTTNEDIVENVGIRISSWIKILRVFAWVIKFINGCKRIERPGGLLKVGDVDRAKTTIFRIVQKKMLAQNPIANLTALKTAERKQQQDQDKLHVWKLDPYLDDEGLLRVGGR